MMFCQQNRTKGFTLIELMIVVAVIATLAVIAASSYQDSVMRGRLADGISSLSNARVKMEQYFQDNRTYSVGGSTTACPATVPASTDFFTYACSNTTATTYTITATGKAGTNVSAFVYTIDQSNAKTTTGLKSGWGSTPQSCWITKKGNPC